jgi:hypothetical protein
MGVEEMIFDCGYWGAGMSQFEKYGPCFNKRGTTPPWATSTTSTSA